MAKLRVGVVGVGGIARTHMPGWAASEHAEVVAGSDVNGDVLKRWGQEHGVGKLHTNPEALFSDSDIDIIDVCTPNMYHAPLSIAAMEAGKHVICEKPLAPTPDDIRDMIAARDKSGKTLMTAQHFRYKGSSKAMKAEIDTGALGDIYHARSWMLRRAAAPTGGWFYSQRAQWRRSVYRYWRPYFRPDAVVYGQPGTRGRNRGRARRIGSQRGRF